MTTDPRSERRRRPAPRRVVPSWLLDARCPMSIERFREDFDAILDQDMSVALQS